MNHRMQIHISEHAYSEGRSEAIQACNALGVRYREAKYCLTVEVTEPKMRKILRHMAHNGYRTQATYTKTITP